MCGIVACLFADPEGNCGAELYEGLNVLQHRGQVRAPPSPIFPFFPISRGCLTRGSLWKSVKLTFGFSPLSSSHELQDAAGIITSKKGRLFQCKGNGLVKDVFTSRQMLQLVGSMGVAHGTISSLSLPLFFFEVDLVAVP